MAEAAAQLQTRLAVQRPALLAQVQQELEAAGGVVAHVHSAPEAVAYITQLAQQKAAHLVVRWQSELLEALEVDAARAAAAAKAIPRLDDLFAELTRTELR